LFLRAVAVDAVGLEELRGGAGSGEETGDRGQETEEKWEPGDMSQVAGAFG